MNLQSGFSAANTSSGWESSKPSESTTKSSDGWNSNDGPADSSGWGSATQAESGGWSSIKTSSGKVSDEKTAAEQTNGGWGSTEAASGWDDKKDAENKNSDSGWGEASAASGWGAPAEESAPKPDNSDSPKPLVVNQPPVESSVNEKIDPRVQKNKKRISLSGKKNLNAQIIINL